ncbi:hypothetical protein PG993_006794 [Apiospora rasikravindrae]|uniref:Uncharacterized protein n=1 Tax=Apiospora rasikravindrae TaxID=990691 RepID=A0ABR1T6P4_9PEZI
MTFDGEPPVKLDEVQKLDDRQRKEDLKQHQLARQRKREEKYKYSELPSARGYTPADMALTLETAEDDDDATEWDG